MDQKIEGVTPLIAMSPLIPGYLAATGGIPKQAKLQSYSANQTGAAGAFQMTIRDNRSPEILKHNLDYTIKQEKEKVGQVLDVLQKFYEGESKR